MPSPSDAAAAFAVTSEQRELRSAVRRFLRAVSSEADVRRVMAEPLGRDPGVWRRLASELGVVGLAVPARYGGAGASWAELAIAAEEFGRALYCGPFLATSVLATSALLAADDADACAHYLPALCRAERVATLALCSPPNVWRPGAQAVRAGTAGRDTAQLDGSVSPVVDGASADLLLVAATAPEGPTLYVVEATAPGVTATALRTLDETRRLAEVRFVGASARRIGRPGAAGPVLSKVADLVAVALAAEQAGVAQRALELAVDYAKTRTQFGAPIGSFQAVKHQCADLLVLVESALTAARYAAWTVAADPDALPAAASMAQAVCSEAAVVTAETALHLHGGIGFTWEHPAHLYYKRAKSDELLFGTPRQHRAVLSERVGISALR